MPGKHQSIAKITRPVLKGIFPRKRLFRQLESCRHKPIVWTTGPPGCGKTTLIASYLDSYKIPSLWYKVDEGDADIATFFYCMGLAAKKAAPHKRKPLSLLTPEYLLGIPTFTLRFFEELYSRLKTPFFIVFDNYQQAPSESKFHEVISNGLSVIPEKINVILISRGSLPRQLVRLQANNKISFLGWNEIRFSLDETREVVQMRRRKDLTDEMLLQLHKKTDGWAAGLILMLEMAEIKSIDYQLTDKNIPEEIFGYFASEILDKTDKETQDFLLKTAFLPQITHNMAQELTGNLQANCILSDLNQKNYFTQRYIHRTEFYRYHPLFREFLLAKSKDVFIPSILAEIKQKAAILLEADGQIEEAVSLFDETGDWQSMIRLILEQAPSLLEQGRNLTLLKWLDILPKDLFEKNPWLLYWLGASQIYINTDKSFEYFKKAFVLFKTQKDAVGIFMTWSGIIYSITYGFQKFKQLDPWISTADELLTEFKAFPSREIEARFATSMLIALSFRQPQHPDFEAWAERALSLSRESADISLKSDTFSTLALHQLFSGDLSKAAHTIDSFHAVIQSGNATPYLQIFFKDIEAFFYWLGAKWEKCYSAAMDGLELSSATGVHLMDSFLSGHGAAGALGAEDTTTAKRFFERMNLCLDKGSAWEQSFYHCLLAWEALVKGDLSKADLHSELMMKFNDESGYIPTTAIGYLLRAIVMHALGKEKEAEGLISEAHTIGCSIKSHLIEFMCLLSEAQFAFDRRDEASGRNLLRNAMAIGSKQGFVNTVLWYPAQMTLLCMKALEANIEVEYVRNLVLRRNLIPESPPFECENWPWPVKVYTFRRFGLLKDGKPVHFSRKIQQKPLSMLKALIALGGRDIKEEQLTDLLWPDAEGDAAHSAFTTTLSRLRQLLGIEEAIKYKEGRITLDSRYCWVDSWIFERLVSKTEVGLKKIGETESYEKNEDEKRIQLGEIITLTEKAINLYKGHFLPADEGYFWTVSYRERLRSKFLRLVSRSGNYLQKSGQWEKAVEYYQRAIEIDDLTEDFYQNLMLCYQQLDQKAEAIKVYQRCCKVLSAVLGIEPSSKTKAIYKELTH